MVDEIVRVKVADVLATVRPIYPEPNDWATTVEYMQNDPVEKEILDTLLGVLRDKGSFRLPVYITTGSFENDVEAPCVGDGTHRFVAHVINGSEYVDVTYARDDDDEDELVESDGKYECVSTSITVAKDSFKDDDAEWELHSVLRSFEASDDVWITSDISSGHHGSYEFTWNLDGASEELMQQITDICIARMDKYLGIKPTHISTSIEIWDDDIED